MSTKTQNSSFESPALKRAISQAVRETSYQLRGTSNKSATGAVREIKKITPVKK